MKAVEHHSPERWMVFYIQRWLKAPIQHKDGKREVPQQGTTQGGVISPLLANLYLHYVFDKWIFNRFLPVVSTAAGKKFLSSLKASRILRMRHLSLDEFARQLNQRVRGWYGYFSHFYRMHDLLDGALLRWLRYKYATSWKQAKHLLQRLARQNPKQFAHWHFRLPGRAV